MNSLSKWSLQQNGSFRSHQIKQKSMTNIIDLMAANSVVPLYSCWPCCLSRNWNCDLDWCTTRKALINNSTILWKKGLVNYLNAVTDRKIYERKKYEDRKYFTFYLFHYKSTISFSSSSFFLPQHHLRSIVFSTVRPREIWSLVMIYNIAHLYCVFLSGQSGWCKLDRVWNLKKA